MTASGGPNAATYMWNSDIATATSVTTAATTLEEGAVGAISSETTCPVGMLMCY